MKIKKIIKKINPARHFSLEINSNLEKTIVLLGSGRSGTTFLSNIINYKNDYRYMFEPFRYSKVKIIKNLGNVVYLRKNERYLIIKKVLSGKIQNSWINHLNKKIISKKRLIKSIRLCFMINYLRRNFPEVSLIFIIRNPFNVAKSRINKKWDHGIQNILKNRKLVNDYLKEKENIIKRVLEQGSEYEKHFLRWCIENNIMIKQSNKNQMFVFFEDLIMYPEKEIKKIFYFLDIKYKESVLRKMKKPSRTTNKKNIETSEILSTNPGVSCEKIEKCKKILEEFNLHRIYDEKGTPNKKELKKLLKK